ncbi:acyl-CoA thioesterase II [Croceicoccus sp. YJ47]|uniref:acyl-CoA thioesterase n=1 Tax=Croceicoccus sp. YJ47 TaxID=2798724 RepID=UPI001924E203|nr:acyl-CoA thioesterase domain-containing protein [Croceicoccus sp. YJ47]QQN75112.1 thioesterase family protein [Croceicoccus sp. YJ47]
MARGDAEAGHVGPARRYERDRLFDLAPMGRDDTGADLFESAPLPSALLRLYGGQPVAQGLWAAQQTMGSDRHPANCHACFLAPGAVDEPIRYTVRRDADGRSFSIRRITAQQGDRLILTMTATFHVAEHGPAAQTPVPDLAAPEDLPDMEMLLRQAPRELPERHRPFWLRDHMFEWRPAEPFRMFERPREPGAQHFWVRLKEPWTGPAGSEHTARLYVGPASAACGACPDRGRLCR